MSTRPVARLKIRISIRVRILLAFTVIYTAFFIVTLRWFIGYLTQFIQTNAPNVLGASATPDVVNSIIDHARAQLETVAPVGFIVSYALLFLVTLAVDHGLSHPLIALSRYAKRVADGDYSPFVLPQPPFFHDEVSDLADSFAQMVDKVHGRELALKQQVAQLQIAVDQERKAKQVGEIVESEFFASLKARAHELRQASENTASPSSVTPFTPPATPNAETS
jgi:methyl-accepting chemotaxis protein